jgi:hypothetical protein
MDSRGSAICCVLLRQGDTGRSGLVGVRQVIYIEVRKRERQHGMAAVPLTPYASPQPPPSSRRLLTAASCQHQLLHLGPPQPLQGHLIKKLLRAAHTLQHPQHHRPVHLAAVPVHRARLKLSAEQVAVL